jgi:hypothetical protein
MLFICSPVWYAKIIRKITAGSVNHVAIVVDKEQIFETSTKTFKAGYQPLPSVTKKGMILVRPTFLTQDHKAQLKVLCEKYKGIPYSLWDVALNLGFGWLKDELKTKVISVLGTKRFMKCDELVARLLYEVSLKKELRWFEGYDPSYLLKICLTHPESFTVLYWNP